MEYQSLEAVEQATVLLNIGMSYTVGKLLDSPLQRSGPVRGAQTCHCVFTAGVPVIITKVRVYVSHFFSFKIGRGYLRRNLRVHSDLYRFALTWISKWLSLCESWWAWVENKGFTNFRARKMATSATCADWRKEAFVCAENSPPPENGSAILSILRV